MRSLHSPAATGEPPKQLKGYASVDLAPGQSRLVLFRLGPSDLAYFNQATNGWSVAAPHGPAITEPSDTVGVTVR